MDTASPISATTLESSDDDDDGSATSRSPSLPPSLPPSQPPSLLPSLPPSMPPSDDEGDDEQPDGLQQMLDAKAAQDVADAQTRKAADQLADEKMPSNIQINPLLEKAYGGKAAAADEPGPAAETQAWGDQGGETQASGTQDDEEEADSEDEPIAELATKRRPRSSPRPSRSASPVAAAPAAKRSRKILDSDDDDSNED